VADLEHRVTHLADLVAKTEQDHLEQKQLAAQASRLREDSLRRMHQMEAELVAATQEKQELRAEVNVFRGECWGRLSIVIAAYCGACCGAVQTHGVGARHARE
jgi:hypothetical protein